MPTKTTINFAALFLLCFLSSFNSISAQTTSGDVTLPADTFALGPALTAYYELNSDNGTFTMAIKCSVPGVFFGVGLGTSMTGADVWIFEIVNNAIRATDCWSTTATKPASDTSRGGTNNIVLLGYEITATYTLVKMQRALNTGDTNDKTIQAGNTDFIWAHGTAATAAYHGATNRGELAFTLVENTPPVGEEGELPIGEGEISVGEEEVIVSEEEPIVEEEEEEIQVDVSSGNVTLPSNMVTLSQFLEVGYELNTTDSSITMTLVCTVPNQFFGFGFGASMFGSDIWVFEIVDSAITATDYYSTSQDFPTPDTDRGGVNNLQVLGYEINSNYTLVKVKRALNTNDSNDKVIVIGSNNVIFATAPSQTLAYHETSKGTGTLTIADPTAGSDSGSGEEEEEEPTGDGSGSTGDAVGDVSVPANTVTLGSYLTISYEMDTNNTNITMLIKCSLPGQFFALGFGEGMLNSDVWLFQLVNSEVTVGDYFSTAYDFPTSDTTNGGQNNLERLGYQITPEYTLVKIRRALVTGDPNDKDIRIGANDVIYASVNSPTVAYHSTGQNGVGTITLVGNSADPEGSEEPSDPGAIGDVTNPSNYFYIGGLLQINFEFTSDNGIIVSFNCSEPNQFFGIGFGSAMTGTDMWIFEIVNSGTAVAATDYKSLTQGAPTMDTRLGGTQDLELLGYKITDSYTFVKVKRALDTGDPNDFILYEGWIDMIYATANTKFLSQHSSSQMGFVIVPFIDGTQGYYVADETDNTDEIHSILNLLAWGLLVDIGIIAVRILRGRKFTFGNVVISAQLIHSAIMWLVFIMSITVSAMSLNKNRSTRGGKLTGLPKNDFHFINGVIMMFLSLLTVVVGVASMLYLKSYKQAPPTLVNIKKLHRWLGYLMYLGAKANIIVGVLIYKDGAWKAPVFVYLGALLVLHMFIQKKYADGFKFSKKIRNITQKPSRKPRHVALMSALNNGVPRERLLLDFPHIKWVQLGNKVYDVTDWTHPGGNFIIQACIGREVGRFIYGNYALESTNFKPHKHSPLALSQLNHFYIGEVTNYESVLVSKNSSQEVVSRVTHEWTIASIRPLSDTVSQVNFESKEIRVKNFGTSLTWLARHFTVGFANRKKPFRLYTIAMSLNEPNTNLRRNLFQYFDDIMSGIPSNFEYDPEYLEPQDTLPIFIKNYSNVNGLSRAIHQASYLEEDCTFRIEGPISRGLELSQASSGTQTIICGGTGLFPFIDFLNFFLWKNMYDLVKKRAGKAKAQEMNILNIPFENYMNGLKLNFFGSFANERDILGLDIITKLAEISEKYELNNFNCMIKGYANEHIIGLRESFNIEFLRKHVSLYEERFYVVGPPRMNSQVPDALKRLGVSEDRIILV